MKSRVALAVIGLCALLTSRAVAETLPSRPILTLDAAHRVLAAAVAEATRRNWPGVIAVVDSEGYLITMDCMDHSPMLASVELAPAKAKTAALFGKPTELLEDVLNKGRTAATTAGFVEMSGGVPLVVDGKEVGAIGVSTAQPAWDLQIASVGASALRD